MGKLVIVKLRKRGELDAQQRLLRRVLGDALEKATPIFPDSAEPSLATVFEARLRDGASVGRVLKKLRAASEIAYAHEPGERRGA